MTTYWLSDFCSLFNSTNINPFSGDDKNFKFNSLTRLILVVTILATMLPNSNINETLIAGAISLFLSIIIYMLTYNSAEMSLELNKELKSYEQEEKLSGDWEEKLKTRLAEMEGKIIKDDNVNKENQITLDYSPPNTQLKKNIYFLEGDKMPNNVVATKRDPSDYLSLGKQVSTGSVKQLHSLIRKDLSFT